MTKRDYEDGGFKYFTVHDLGKVWNALTLSEATSKSPSCESSYVIRDGNVVAFSDYDGDGYTWVESDFDYEEYDDG